MKSIKNLYPMFLKYFELFLLYFRLFWVILTYFGIFWHILWVSCENIANLILITTIFLRIIFVFSKTIKSNLLQSGPFTLLRYSHKMKMFEVNKKPKQKYELFPNLLFLCLFSKIKLVQIKETLPLISRRGKKCY